MKKCRYCESDVGSRGSKYCSNQCQKNFEYESWINRWKSGKESGKRGKTGISAHIRRYLFELHNSSCCKCGWNKTNSVTGKVPLEINHKNGNWTDNSESNLELICPNCHSLEPTYKALNKGNGRYKVPGVINPGNGKRQT